MDRFPEAFRRFERDVDAGRFESYHQLTLAFRWWAGERWRGTSRQLEALNNEAENLGFNVPDVYREAIREKHYTDFHDRARRTWKQEVVTVKGKAQNRYRDIKTGRFIPKPNT
jgi:predicted glycosyltransferase involved in capsule biosynthesis